MFHGLLEDPGPQFENHELQYTKKYKCFISSTVSLAQPWLPIGCFCPASLLGSFLRPLKCVGSHAPAWHRLITCSGDPLNELSILSLNSCKTTDVFMLQEKLHNMQNPQITGFSAIKPHPCVADGFILKTTGQDLCNLCSRQKMAADTR